MMRSLSVACLLVIFGTAAAFGQQQFTNQEMATPRFDLALGYNYIKANAPPGDCNCFSMHGGFASANYQVWNWLGVTGKFTGNHANDISDLGQDLTLMTFLGGPRVSLPYRRITPYGEALFGVARGSDSYFPSGTSSTTSATSFAYSAGGGVDFNLTHRFAIRAADVQYLRSSLPNGAGNTQNHLQIGAGLVIRFGGWSRGSKSQEVAPIAPAAQQQAAEVAFSCSANTTEVTAGDLVQIVGDAVTLPADQSVDYTWTSSGGAVRQDGHIVTIDTAGLNPGEYRVMGHAFLVSNPSVSGNCSTTFHVNEKSTAQSSPEENSISEDDFRDHVKDAFFNYDSYDLRPDAQQALNLDIAYLNAHPDLQITIGGYADERGSAEFNLALGLNRANAARTALIIGGVTAARIQVISYGKEKQFCMEDTDSCYQQNRRAQLMLRR